MSVFIIPLYKVLLISIKLSSYSCNAINSDVGSSPMHQVCEYTAPGYCINKRKAACLLTKVVSVG